MRQRGPEQPQAHVRESDTRPPRARAFAMCDRMASEGISLRKSAVAEGLGHADFLWLVRKDDELRIAYEQAREIGREVTVDSLREEAEQVMKTALMRGSDASSYVAAFNVRVGLIRWEAERREPKKYGARLDVNHSGTIDLAARLASARSRGGIIDVAVEPTEPDEMLVIENEVK